MEAHNAQESLEKSDKRMIVPCRQKLTFPVISKISVDVNAHTLNAIPYSSVLPPQLILRGRRRRVVSIIIAWKVASIFLPWEVATRVVSYRFGLPGLYSGQTDDHGQLTIHTEVLKLVIYFTMWESILVKLYTFLLVGYQSSDDSKDSLPWR